jgi:hypothetical protein
MITADNPGDAVDLDHLLNQAWSWEVVLRKLLAVNPGNRMAFEYLMSWYLLNGNPDRVVELLPRLAEFGIDEIPPLYQEAAMTDSVLSGRKPPAALAARLDRDLVARYLRFGALLQSKGGQPAAALEALRNRDRGSYFAYFLWLVSDEEHRDERR